MSSSLALLVIDVQTGAFDGQRCPPIAEADRLLSTTQGLIAAARAASRPVIHVQHGDVAGQVFEEGSAQWHIHASVAPAAGELLVGKRESSAFAGTALEAELRRRGITTLAVCGLQSEHCGPTRRWRRWSAASACCWRTTATAPGPAHRKPCRRSFRSKTSCWPHAAPSPWRAATSSCVSRPSPPMPEAVAYLRYTSRR